MTGGRLKRVSQYLENPFLSHLWRRSRRYKYYKLINHHINSTKLATLTATKPTGRFGIADINDKNEGYEISRKTRGK